MKLGEEKLWSSMNKKRRNTIKKAISQGVQIKAICEESQIYESYNIIKQVYDKARIPLAHYSLFSSTFHKLHNKKMVKCFSAFLDNKMIGTVWLLTFKNRAYDWYSGSLSNYLSKSPNDLMLWHFDNMVA